MTGWTFIKGTTRAVLCIGGLAIKFARSADGARGNRFEADLYRRSDPERRKLLCTPLWCSPNGAVLMMRRARPMTEGDFASMSSPACTGRGTIVDQTTTKPLSSPRRRIGDGSMTGL